MLTYFLTQSWADLTCDELPYIIKKIKNFGLKDQELKKLSFQENCNLLNKNPVLVIRHFWRKVGVFFKEIIRHGPHAIRTEFQKGVVLYSPYGFSMHQRHLL